MVQKIISSLSLRVATQTLRSKDTRQTLQIIFNQWLSLSTCAFQAVVEIVPPPFVAQRLRLPKILYPDLALPSNPGSGNGAQEMVKPKNKLEEDLYGCKEGDGTRVVAFISKMFAMPQERLPQAKKITKHGAKTNKEAGSVALDDLRSDDTTTTSNDSPSCSEADQQEAADGEDTGADKEEQNEILLGFARLYSGTLSVSSSGFFVILPKYNTSLPPVHPRNKPFILGPVQISSLYEMMGRDLVRVENVRAGSVFAVEGLEGVVGRSGTLISGPPPGVNDEKSNWVNLAGLGSRVSFGGPSCHKPP